MKTTKFLMMAAAALLLAACSNDEDAVNDGPVEAKVSASFGAESRAVNTDDTWTAQDSIGVMATSAPTSGTAMTGRYKNVKYTTATGGSSAAFAAAAGRGIFFQDAAETVTFSAYYPYRESAADALPGTDGAVAVDTQDNNTAAAQAGIDFLFASGATATKSNPTVSFSGADHQFKHCMAQLNLVITAATDHGFTAAEAAAILETAAGTYKLGGLVHAGTFNVTTGATAATGSAVDGWDITSLVHSDVADTHTRTYTLILLPQDKSGSALSFSAAIGGQTYTNSSSIAPNLEAGKKYTYSITLKKTGITVSGCTIAGWGTGTSGSGEATM